MRRTRPGGARWPRRRAESAVHGLAGQRAREAGRLSALMLLSGCLAGAADRSERERDARGRADFNCPGCETVIAERQLHVGEQHGRGADGERDTRAAGRGAPAKRAKGSTRARISAHSNMARTSRLSRAATWVASSPVGTRAYFVAIGESPGAIACTITPT